MENRRGKCFQDVSKFLKRGGVQGDELEIRTLGRGTDHIIILRGNVIGEYNHVSRIIGIYKDAPIVEELKENGSQLVTFKLDERI